MLIPATIHRVESPGLAVDEAEWLGSEHVLRMLDFLSGEKESRLRRALTWMGLRTRPTSVRKLRLYASACCRENWKIVGTDESRELLDAADLAAESEMTSVEWQKLKERIEAVANQVPEDSPKHFACVTAITASSIALAHESRYDTAIDCVQKTIIGDSGIRVLDDGDGVPNEVRFTHMDERLLRDIVGNPFRPTSIKGFVVSTVTTVIQGLARGAYEERELPSGRLDATRLAVLADAVEEAGCTNAALLAHLRSEGPHVRGCWAVDLLLGRS